MCITQLRIPQDWISRPTCLLEADGWDQLLPLQFTPRRMFSPLRALLSLIVSNGTYKMPDQSSSRCFEFRRDLCVKQQQRFCNKTVAVPSPRWAMGGRGEGNPTLRWRKLTSHAWSELKAISLKLTNTTNHIMQLSSSRSHCWIMSTESHFPAALTCNGKNIFSSPLWRFEDQSNSLGKLSEV